jgi:hypothetical protein
MKLARPKKLESEIMNAAKQDSQLLEIKLQYSTRIIAMLPHVVQDPRSEPMGDFHIIQDLITINIYKLKSESETVFGGASQQIMTSFFEAQQHSFKIQVHSLMATWIIVKVSGDAFVTAKTTEPNLQGKTLEQLINY